MSRRKLLALGGLAGALAGAAGVAVAAGTTLVPASLTIGTTSVTPPRVQPALAAAPVPTFAVAGSAVSNAASLSSGTTTSTGSISYSLFGPGDATCASAVATRSAAVNGNGNYMASPAPSPTATGTYRWTVSYSGDARNAPAPAPSAACGNGGSLVIGARSAVALENIEPPGGVDNRIDPFESLVIRFAKAVNPSTICPGWDGSAFVQGSGLNNKITVTLTKTATTNLLGIGGVCPSISGQPNTNAVRVGSVDMQSLGYRALTTSLVYEGSGANATNMTLSPDGSGSKLTVTLGAGTPSLTAAAGGPAVFSTDAAVRNTDETAAATGQRSVGLLF